jgi:cell division protein FtsB
MTNKEKLRQQLEVARKEHNKLRDVEKELIAERARSVIFV